jgi:hypothetical protein
MRNFVFGVRLIGIAVLLCVAVCIAVDSELSGDLNVQQSLEKDTVGLTCEFFGNTELNRSFGVRLAPDIDAMYNDNSNYGLRFNGFLTPPLEGEYEFRAEADTGVRLIVDGKKVIDGWALDGVRTGKAVMTKGRATPLIVEYFFDIEKGGKKALLRLFWTPPGKSEEAVPAAAYSHLPLPPPAPRLPSASAPINVYGDEQAHLNLALPEGGLKPVVALSIFRYSAAPAANRNWPMEMAGPSLITRTWPAGRGGCMSPGKWLQPLRRNPPPKSVMPPRRMDLVGLLRPICFRARTPGLSVSLFTSPPTAGCWLSAPAKRVM